MKSLSLMFVAYLALVLQADNAFAAKDFSMRIPFTGVILQPYDQLTAYRVKGQYEGLNIQCSVFDNVAVHPIRTLYIDSSNYAFNPNDTPNGKFAMAGKAPAIYIKYNIKSIDPNYSSYIRIYGVENVGTDTMTATCEYFNTK
jgi:hypothetical protein